MVIKTIEQLRALYDDPKGRAVDKQLDFLEQHACNFIEHSPFLIISSYDCSGNVDASPKGGIPGFAKVLDSNRILIPDSKGNNRLDGLTNIIETGRVGLLFLIPGVDETLRINGSAAITTESDCLDHFSSERKPPVSCLLIKVEEVFLHCAKALMRSKLWHDDYKIIRSNFPTMGKMLKDQIGGSGPIESHADMVIRYKKDL